MVLIRPAGLWMAALLAFACAICIALFLALGQYTKRTHITGVLVSDNTVVKVSSPTPGVIVERRVREGQQVKAGDLLFIVNASSTAAAETPAREGRSPSDDKRKQLSTLTKQHQELSLGASELETEAQKLDKQVSSQSQKLANARTRMKQLRQAQAMGGDESLLDPGLQQKLDEVLDMRNKLQATEKNKERASKEAAQARTELAQLAKRIEAAKQEVARSGGGDAAHGTAPAQVKVDNTYRVAITAPVAGVVGSLAVDSGSAVGNQTLLTIAQAGGGLEAQLYAPVMAAGFVQPGQKLRIRYAGLSQSQAQHEGEVLGISTAALPAAEIPEAVSRAMGADASEGLYRIRVGLNNQPLNVSGRALRLTPGMQVEADILQDTRRLIEWVFAPRDARPLES